MRNIWLAVIVLAWFSTQSAVAEEAGIKVLCSHFRESARFGDAFGFKWDSSTNIAVLSDLESFFLFSPSRFPDHRGKPSKEPSYVPVKVGAKSLIRDDRWEESAAYVVEVAIDKVDSETVSITLSASGQSRTAEYFGSEEWFILVASKERGRPREVRVFVGTDSGVTHPSQAGADYLFVGFFAIHVISRLPARH